MARHTFGPFSYVGWGWGNRTYEVKLWGNHLIAGIGFDPMHCCRTMYLLVKYEYFDKPVGYFHWKYQWALYWGTDQYKMDRLSMRELWSMMLRRLKW